MTKKKRTFNEHITKPSEVAKKHNTRSQFRVTNPETFTSPSLDTMVQPAAIREHQLKDLAAKSQQSLMATTEHTKVHIANQFDNILEKLLKGKINFNTASEYITKKQTINRENDLQSLKLLEDTINDYNKKLQNVSDDNPNNHSYITSDIMNTYQALEQKSDSYEFSRVWRYFHSMSSPERELFREGWEVTLITPATGEEEWFKQEMKVSEWKDDDVVPGFILDHPQALLQRFIKHETEKIINQPIIAHLEKKCEQELDDPRKETYKQILEYLYTGEQPAGCRFRIETHSPPEFDKKLQRLRAGIRKEGEIQKGEFISEREQTYITTEARSLWSKFTKEKAITKHNTKHSTNIKLNSADKKLVLANFSEMLIGNYQAVKEFDEYGNQIALWSPLVERVIKKGPFIIGIDYRTRNNGGIYIISVEKEDRSQVIAVSTACGKLSNNFGLDKNRIPNVLKNINGATMPKGIAVYAWIDSTGKDLLV